MPEIIRVMSKLYDVATSFWYRTLKHPLRLHTAFDNHRKDPVLTIVFLHGISATSTTWWTLLRDYDRDPHFRAVRLITIDLLGFGKSPHASWMEYDYAEYDEALDRTLLALNVSTPVVLVGHSMGSLIAANYATNFQPSVDLRRLILVSPPVLMAKESARLPDEIYKKSYGALNQLAKEEPAIDVIANFIQRFSHFRGKYLKTAAFGKSMENIILNSHNYQTFLRIKIPTLLLHGHFDPLVMRSNLKRVAERNPKVRYVSVIGHHDVSFSKRIKILAETKQILQEIEHEQQ